MKRLALLFLILCLASFASVSITSVADVSGDASAHAIAASGSARWIQFIADPANSAAVRVGDSNVSTSRGLAIAAGAGYLMPPMTSHTNEAPTDRNYDLSKVFYVAQSGDKLQILYVAGR